MKTDALMITSDDTVRSTAKLSMPLWRPGISLMRSLDFGTKAMIICAIFLAPILLLSANLWLEKRAAIVATEREMQGLDYVKATYELVRGGQLAMQHALAGDAAALGNDRQSLDTDMQALAQVERAHGTLLGTGKAFDEVQKRYQSLGGSSEGLKAFVALRELDRSVNALLKAIANGSGLTLESDAVGYYLIDMLTSSIPQFGELTAQDLAAGATSLQAKTVSPLMQRVFSDNEVMVDYQTRNIESSLAKVLDLAPEVETKLQGARMLSASAALFKAIEKDITDATDITADRAAFIATGNGVLKNQIEFANNAMQITREMLERRNVQLQLQIWWMAAGIALVLVIVFYLFYTFYLVTRGGLRLISGHLQELSAGDLRRLPGKPWGKDEPATVILDLQKTYTSLHQLIRRVRHSARELHQTASVISESSSSLSARTDATAANLEQQSTTIGVIGAKARETAELAKMAATFASENANVAENGGKVFVDVVATMREIHLSSNKISDIIGVIDGIAFQTNILALNAAVEAARAGDSGRGFAVVASEVRSLAKRSADAAREIKSLIAASLAKVESGTRIVESAGNSMGEVVANASQINTFLSEISIASNNQAIGVDEVSIALAELDHSTHENALLVGQTTEAAEILRGQADLLIGEIANFRVA